jgi:transcription initiation factor TFIIIB Brf1 subunit/transcription initiation factor TFIIB
MDDETRALLADLKDLFFALREADKEAVRLRHADLTLRMEGFPQEFARKAEMVEASRALQKLERDSISREVYDAQHSALEDLVAKLDKDKMPEAVFQTFVLNYRLEQEAAATERRAVASALAATVERREGSSATWRQIAGIVSVGVAVLGVLLTIVVLLANHVIH